MFTFRETIKDRERLARRIRGILEGRHAMPIGELLMRLGMDQVVVQGELEKMMARGEVERLRPIACSKEDHDFFRLNRPASLLVESDESRIWQDRRSGQKRIRLAGEATACLVD